MVGQNLGRKGASGRVAGGGRLISHDPVSESSGGSAKARQKSRIVERPVKGRRGRQRRSSAFVESHCRSIRVHRGAVQEPLDPWVLRIDRSRPPPRVVATPRADGHRCAGLRGPDAGQVEQQRVSNDLEPDQPGRVGATVDDARRQKHFREAGCGVGGCVQDAPRRMDALWRVMVVKACVGRSEEAEGVPDGWVSPARGVDPPKHRACLEWLGARGRGKRIRRGGELRHLRSRPRVARRSPGTCPQPARRAVSPAAPPRPRRDLDEGPRTR